jgi:small subunit ribosomal protein S16
VVRIRLQRFGRRNRPFYRLAAIDQRNQRDGKTIEELGWYDPIERDQSKQMELNADRLRYWISVGAQPTRTVASLLRKAGVTAAAEAAK